MAEDTVQAELERLRAENAALKGRAAKGLTLKVNMEGLEALDHLRGLTYALSELARSTDQGVLKSLAVGVLERAVSSECDSLRESVRRKEI